MSSTILSPNSPAVGTSRRPRVEGKFLFLGDEKFFVKGVTYGSFPPDSQGYEFPEPADVENDFALMPLWTSDCSQGGCTGTTFF